MCIMMIGISYVLYQHLNFIHTGMYVALWVTLPLTSLCSLTVGLRPKPRVQSDDEHDSLDISRCLAVVQVAVQFLLLCCHLSWPALCLGFNIKGKLKHYIIISHPYPCLDFDTTYNNLFFSSTGTKFFAVCEPGIQQIESLLKFVYELYTDYVLKNPFYEIEMPIRCELFDIILTQSVQKDRVALLGQ